MIRPSPFLSNIWNTRRSSSASILTRGGWDVEAVETTVVDEVEGFLLRKLGVDGGGVGGGDGDGGCQEVGRNVQSFLGTK